MKTVSICAMQCDIEDGKVPQYIHIHITMDQLEAYQQHINNGLSIRKAVFAVWGKILLPSRYEHLVSIFRNEYGSSKQIIYFLNNGVATLIPKQYGYCYGIARTDRIAFNCIYMCDVLNEKSDWPE